MKAIDFNKVGLIALTAFTAAACDTGLTGPDADVEGLDAAYTWDPTPKPISPTWPFPPPPPPVLIFENGNETLCVPAGRSHQVEWRVYDPHGQVNVNLRSRAPGTTATTSEFTRQKTNSNIRTGEGSDNFSAIIGQDANGYVRMDPLREYQYSVWAVTQYQLKPVISRSGWFRVAYTAQGTTLICY